MENIPTKLTEIQFDDFEEKIRKGKQIREISPHRDDVVFCALFLPFGGPAGRLSMILSLTEHGQGSQNTDAIRGYRMARFGIHK